MNSVDFYTVQCETRFRVNATRNGCLTGPQGDNGGTVFGATHIRYNCTTKRFHILTYAFEDMIFDPIISAMWTATCNYEVVNGVEVTNDCKAAGDRKFIQFEGGLSGAQCASDSCNTAPVCIEKGKPIACRLVLSRRLGCYRYGQQRGQVDWILV